MSRYAFLFFLPALVLAVCAGPARADKRVALVIGNGQYVSPSTQLRNAPNDARKVGSALIGIGFDVTLGINLDQAGMESLLRKFLDGARTAQVALLFYAGHGMQVDGHNYLIPVDARVESRSDLNFGTVDLD